MFLYSKGFCYQICGVFTFTPALAPGGILTFHLLLLLLRVNKVSKVQGSVSLTLPLPHVNFHAQLLNGWGIHTLFDLAINRDSRISLQRVNNLPQWLTELRETLIFTVRVL